MIFTWQKHYSLNYYYCSNYNMILELKSLQMWADNLTILRFNIAAACLEFKTYMLH